MFRHCVAEKILEDYPDVFADIVNGFLFDGEEVIKPEELEDMPGRSAYRAEKKLHDMERDVAKRWKKNDIRIACVGFENQTAPDPLMVLRVLGYDGAEYRAQCLKENVDKPPYPVITLVLYFGCERRWTEAKTLYEAVNVPDVFRPYVTNTKINVFEVAWLETIRHVEELLMLLSVMEHDDRYEKLYYEKAVEGGSWNMCKIIDDYIKMGEDKKEAEVNERVATDMIRDKKPLKEILKYSKLSEETIRKLAKSMGVAVL